MRTSLTRCFEHIMTMEISWRQSSSLQQRRHSSSKFAWGKATPTSKASTGVAQRTTSMLTSLTRSQPSFAWRTSGSSTKLPSTASFAGGPSKVLRAAAGVSTPNESYVRIESRVRQCQSCGGTCLLQQVRKGGRGCAYPWAYNISTAQPALLFAAVCRDCQAEHYLQTYSLSKKNCEARVMCSRHTVHLRIVGPQACKALLCCAKAINVPGHAGACSTTSCAPCSAARQVVDSSTLAITP